MKALLRIFCIALTIAGCQPIAGGGYITPYQQYQANQLQSNAMQGVRNNFANIQRNYEIGMAQIKAKSQQRQMQNYLNNNPGTPVFIAPQLPATQVIGSPYGGYGYTPPPATNYGVPFGY